MERRLTVALRLGFAALPLLVAVPALLISSLHGFDGLYGQDAFAYVDYALGPLRAALLAGQAPPDFPLPPGYPLLVSLASVVAGPSDAVATTVSLVAGASVPVLVAILARELRPDADRRIAILAGLIAAVPGQLWQSSLVAMPDAPALAAATLGTLAAARFHRTGRGRWLLVAAGALALATEIRLVYGVTAAVFGTLVLGRLRGDLRAEPARALALAGGAAAVGVSVLAPMLVPVVAALLAGRPAPFGVELGVAPLDPLTPVRSTFATADGRLEYDLPMAVWLTLQPVQPYWFGGLGLLVPIGLIDVARTRLPRAPELAALVAWPGLMGLVLVLYPYQNTRFVLGLLPPLAILAACGVARIWNHLSRPRSRALAGASLVLLLVANAGLAWRHADAFVLRQAADLAAIQRLAAELPKDAALISLGATGALRHEGRAVVELYTLTVEEADALVAAGPTYLLVDVAALQGQWREATPGRTFEHLGATPGLVELDAAGDWTLLEVRQSGSTSG